MWHLLTLLHGDGTTTEAISDAFDDLFGNDHPLRNLADERSGGRVSLRRLLADLESSGFVSDPQVDRSGKVDRVRHRVRGTATVAPALTPTEAEAMRATRVVVDAVTSGALHLLIGAADGPGAVGVSALSGLAEAVRNRTVVSFAFGPGLRRELHPYTMVLGPRGRWFVGGWCRHAEDIRTFPVNDVRDIHPVPERQFREPQGGDLEAADNTNPLWWDMHEPLAVTLECNPDTPPEAFEALGLTLPDSADVAGEYALTVTNREWLLRVVAANWPNVHLVGPPSLVDELLARLDRISGQQ